MIEGKNGIYAKVLVDSVCPKGNRLTTYEIAYPRVILAELNTHQMLPKNSASSRAIPFEKMLDNLTGKPVRFGANQAGMQDKGEDLEALVNGWEKYNSCEGGRNLNPLSPIDAWEEAKQHAIFYSKAFKEAGYHKQVYNRLTESFQMMKTVISGTEWDNFFWLRNDGDADPTFHELARCIQEAKDASTPQLLEAGMWHLPYVMSRIVFDGDTQEAEQQFYQEGEDGNASIVPHEDAIIMSVARTAAVSFRNIDYDQVKCNEVFRRLLNSGKIHGSAFAHAARVMGDTVIRNPLDHSGDDFNNPLNPDSWEKGISHMDRERNLWSAHYKGFIQYRKLIVGENYKESK
jgi:hypothetical protein